VVQYSAVTSNHLALVKLCGNMEIAFTFK